MSAGAYDSSGDEDNTLLSHGANGDAHVTEGVLKYRTYVCVAVMMALLADYLLLVRVHPRHMVARHPTAAPSFAQLLVVGIRAGVVNTSVTFDVAPTRVLCDRPSRRCAADDHHPHHASAAASRDTFNVPNGVRAPGARLRARLAPHTGTRVCFAPCACSLPTASCSRHSQPCSS